MPPSNPKALLRWGVGVVAIILTAIFAGKQQQSLPTPQADSGFHQVAYVYDGDTIKLDNGERVRFIGIDTPESRDNEKLSRDSEKLGKDKNVILAMGKKASNFTKALLNGQMVRVETDVQPRDRYGRLLGYVYLKDGTFVNAKIIAEGYAYPMTIPPNVSKADEFRRLFNEAREQQKGLWKGKI